MSVVIEVVFIFRGMCEKILVWVKTSRGGETFSGLSFELSKRGDTPKVSPNKQAHAVRGTHNVTKQTERHNRGGTPNVNTQ